MEPLEDLYEVITQNPFRKDTAAWKFCEIANVDYSNGYSDIVPYEEFEKLGLSTGNGIGWARSDGAKGSLGGMFNIDRQHKGGRVHTIQLIGYRKDEFQKRIDIEIKKYYKLLPCVILDIGGNYIEVDHKDGRYDSWKDQKIGDFQSLHKSANDAKRTHCNVCKITNIRFDARKLGYLVPQWIGTLEYKGTCVGCYWYDPREFNYRVSECFKKVR